MNHRSCKVPSAYLPKTAPNSLDRAKHRRLDSATARGAQISLGRYRLWGAGMAAAGGLVSIGWDVADAMTVHSNTSYSLNKRNLLISAYFARVSGTTALLIGQGGIAISQASAYFNWLAIKARSGGQQAFFLTLTQWSTRLATNQTAMLLLGRMTWIGGVIVLGATVVLLLVDENAMEKWCNQCCFSRNTEAKRYKNDGDELGALFNAINEIA
ncbi:hypothetical protein [Pseudomonas sp. JUb96]|uniref:hypothetical protein n=1 Tax=Pseudomonas sp. JUb96 TaxID=2940539 RepID=UPI002227C83A|nr:hypothetical protein [Pseudomonas sp. JUb96]MCW2270623.1 hypothetical protein [Pseudomonas sp. JUb96]